MKTKTILSIIAVAGLLTACGKEEVAKPAASAQAPAPVADTAPTPAPAPAQSAQAGDKPADTAADGGPRLKKSDKWSR